MISSRLLERLENYFGVHYISLEWLREQHSKGVHFSLDMRLGDEPQEDSLAKTIINRIKDKLGMLDNPFAEYLWTLIDKKGMTDVETYKKAHLDRRIFSKLRNDKDYMPSKRTILAIAFALECDFKEANTLLHRAGYHLNRSSKEDVIVGYFFENHIYDLFLANEVLDHYGFKPLN